ncbi:MAG: transglutaminase-like domain-containing protein [Chloroflexi bacterium]|nr:transglutaminase-like domain-containing protein [Chloroflexota bacterium]
MTTVQRPAQSATLQRYESTFGRVYRKVFNDRPELSLRVRTLVAAATVWASLSLFLIGVSPVVALLTIPATLIGHWVAFRAIRRRMPWISMMIAGAIITAGVTMRFELVEALQGNRIPVANFLLIAAAASVFDARTRAGLYTQIVFSGLVMFFAAEKAFGNEFVGLLGGYMAIVVIFLATAQYVDLTASATVKGLSTRFGSAVYWLGATMAVVIASIASFLILPWDTSQTPQAARMAFLPITGEDSPLPKVDLETAQDLVDEGAVEGPAQASIAPDLFAHSGLAETDGPATVDDLLGEPSDIPAEFYGAPLIYELGGEDKVAYVRSPVASYWRGRVYDTFDPDANDGLGLWYSTITDDRQFRSLFSRGGHASENNRYLQTYFVQDDLGSNLLTGYEPIAIAVPRDNRGRINLTPGSTYQVVSEQPETDPDILRRDRAEWIEQEYGAIPQGFEEIHRLTSALTNGAENDFDRASAITSYLQNLEYDVEAESPLTPSTDLKRFVIGELPGSAIDFATALTLMARSAGLQSRIATGYLPGEYNTYSGASKITADDAHAWSEIYFRGAGWIPFDASTRPDLPTVADIEQPPPSGLSSLLDRRLGDSLAAAAGRTPGALLKGFEFAVKHGVNWGLFALAGAGFAAMLVWYLFFHRRRSSHRPVRFDYESINGLDRKAIIKAFVSVEKRLAKSGFRRRMKNESYREYAFAVQAHQQASGHAADPATTGQINELLNWLADAASRAAFSSAEVGSDQSQTASIHARDLRTVLS